ncbi:MAG TPA: hypothetical protein VLK65_17875 [Vicinamibacteria bacterium]|nr:hypothetical protein [Vicinamibacteria bacterium]
MSASPDSSAKRRRRRVDDGVEVTATPNGPSLELGKPVLLFDLRLPGASGEPEIYESGGNSGAGYDVLPDGRFVMTRHPDRSTSREIVLVRNWLSELERAGSRQE